MAGLRHTLREPLLKTLSGFLGASERSEVMFSEGLKYGDDFEHLASSAASTLPKHLAQEV